MKKKLIVLVFSLIQVAALNAIEIEKLGILREIKYELKEGWEKDLPAYIRMKQQE